MTETPNAEQVRYWNETAGPKWVALQEVLDAQITVLGLRAMERAAVAPGARVLDVGCGCGGTTLELARRAGAAGEVTGVDVSEPMLARARARAAAAGVRATFVAADAQTHPFPAGAYDVVFSRFGVMFFSDPVAAFRNLHRALAPGGRLAFVCWQPLDRNPWAYRPLAAAARHIPLPPPPAPGTPGPFAFADPERVRGILADAGFGDVVLDDVRETLTVGGGGSLDQAVEFLLEIGPMATALREADPALRPAVMAAVRDALADAHGPEGVRLGSAAWVVSARR